MCRAPPTLAVSHIACNRHLTPLQLLGKLCQKEMQLIYPLFYYDCGVHACGAQHSRDATVASARPRLPPSLQYEPRLSFGRRQGKKQHPSLSHLICRAFDTQACAANAYAQAGQAHCSVQISLLPLAQVLGYARCSCAHFLAPVGTDLRRCTHT